MRTMILAALIAVVLLVQVDRGRAQVDIVSPGTVFFQADNHFTVTIARSGAVIGTLSFPKGTLSERG